MYPRGSCFLHIHFLYFWSPADIDECGQAVSPCDPSFVCRNTIGAFTCSCPRGTTEINGKCMKKKEYNGNLRAPRLNFTADLYNPNSKKYKRYVMDMSNQVGIGMQAVSVHVYTQKYL